MPLIRAGVFVDDPYTDVADDRPVPEQGGFIVSLARFRKDRDDILTRNVAVGVRLKAEESPETIAKDVQRLSVVALEFPRFRDGRAFSWARMLRVRLGFKGEIRGTGHFLYDQIAFMKRTGFDTFEVQEGFALEQFRRALSEISDVYQPSADDRKTIGQQRNER